MSSMTNNGVEISSFYPHLSMMPSLMNTAPKLPPNIYRPNSWMDLSMQPYFYYNIAVNDPNHKRKNATRETTATLKAWLYEHRKNPYPTKNEKMILAMVTKMTLTQVSTWFANARRRLKKENKLNRTTTNSKSEEEEDDDDDEDVDDDVADDEDENENENESHINIEHEQPPVKISNTNNNNNSKRKHDDNDTNSLQMPAKNRPKIWSIVDVVQSNETKQTKSSSSPLHIIHPYITPSIPYLLYPPSSTSSPPHSSEHSTNSLSSLNSSSTSCSPTK
ncbi:unnamed protein product [Rotaria magnacalcarata]|uniref:Homeobox domain-containing protein n=1 Tax=Rotaria magnacalcarata TaxID=392030 RepID=A0A814E6L0_9BILA|nr:unnamed protein product [Rotaria magnacalcarata]CAF1571878.1 unnamed protein product [Rotaria magnacalcarata]CAF1990285.1 unnamed protein product [Rotaria magnacalcarata]CAF2113161.1 unnamed protein product [Rotaria magnacalcarata]CAF2118836.1 unnamed protein product [Rotaria magnacalcarata]